MLRCFQRTWKRIQGHIINYELPGPLLEGKDLNSIAVSYKEPSLKNETKSLSTEVFDVSPGDQDGDETINSCS
ncbi:hypothetical protein J6590_062267 [Homalodisca vitripennis]|nr:hypothetical protein J6590_062267 [Homalodisca vitripennis]